jgi:hypothetical protein
VWQESVRIIETTRATAHVIGQVMVTWYAPDQENILARFAGSGYLWRGLPFSNYESTLFEHEPYVNFEILSSDFRCDDSMDFNDDYSSQERRIFEIFSLACSQTLQLWIVNIEKFTLCSNSRCSVALRAVAKRPLLSLYQANTFALSVFDKFMLES